ncbi:hypothetical protein GGS21DRAFT_355739 [Xylaria nigripes]|nr:hypothetical protein GGS21DRAFT_355739 [Xylaria nigripes]
MALGSTYQTVSAAASILASGWAAGIGTGLSLLGIPAILNGGAPSTVMLRQWQFQFLRGQAIMPALAVFNAINYGTVAYRCWGQGVEWRGYAAAGVSTFFIIPYTLVFLMGINRKLLTAVESRGTLSDESIRMLIQKWGELNLVRAVVPIIGTGLALWNFCL